MADVLELTVSVDEMNNLLKDAVVSRQPSLPETPKPKTVAEFRRPRTLKLKIGPHHSERRRRSRRMQVYRHRLGLTVLCFRNRGYCLTDGVTSHVRENDPDWMDSLLDRLKASSSTVIYVTDEASFEKWHMLVRKAQDGRLDKFAVIKLNATEGKCPTCDENCMRFAAVRALNSLRRVPVDPIPHGKR